MNMGVYGLAWAQSIVAAVEVLILFIIMSARIPELFDFRFANAVSRMVAATFMMAIVLRILLLMLPLNITYKSFWATFPTFALLCMASGIAYVFFSKLLRIAEADPLLAYARKLLFAQLRVLGGRP